jgi:hypothetical protein
MSELTAADARKLMVHSPESSERLRKAIAAVEQKIKEKAASGRATVMDPFNNLGLTSGDISELSSVFRRRGFKYTAYDDPDPGHPCSRPYSELSW